MAPVLVSCEVPLPRTNKVKETPSLQQVLDQLDGMADLLADPTTRAGMSYEDACQLLSSMKLAIATARGAIGLRGPACGPTRVVAAAHGLQVPSAAPHGVVGEDGLAHVQKDKGADKTAQRPAPGAAFKWPAAALAAGARVGTGHAPSAPGAQVLHPAHVMWYNKALRPVYTGTRGSMYVLAAMSGKKVYMKSIAASSCATLRQVAPLPPAEAIQALKATPTGTYLLRGISYHAVYEGPRGGKFRIVDGQKDWVKRAQVVRLLLTEHDGAAMAAAASV